MVRHFKPAFLTSFSPSDTVVPFNPGTVDPQEPGYPSTTNRAPVKSKFFTVAFRDTQSITHRLFDAQLLEGLEGSAPRG